MIGNDWDIILKDMFNSEYFTNLMKKVNEEYSKYTCYPKYDDIFNALKYTSYEKTKVVIIGQDPYHGEGEAHGLSFSVQDGVKIPPSLRNIYLEMHNDIGTSISNSGNLTSWTRKGILLLNSVLTVRKDSPASHKDLGWQVFTDNIIKKLNEKETPVVFILWGAFARSKKVLITNSKHLVIESTHPSPFSANNGFFGSKPFSKANNFLKKNRF